MWMGRIVPAALTAAVLVLPGAAGAVSFTGSWAVTALNSSDPGLVVEVDPSGGAGTTPGMAVGESISFDLFRIWTTEGSVNAGEDTVPKPIAVRFDFTDPVMSGIAGGSTAGLRIPDSGIVSGAVQKGVLSWDGPLVLNFGPQNSGKITIALADAVFNTGVFSLFGGEHFGADVRATLSYDMAPVPVPAALPLLLGGIGLLGAAGRRRRGRLAA